MPPRRRQPGNPAEAVPEKTPEPTAAPLAPAETDAELTARVEETLRPFFAMTGDVAQRPRPQRGVLRRVRRASRAAGDARGAPRPRRILSSAMRRRASSSIPPLPRTRSTFSRRELYDARCLRPAGRRRAGRGSARPLRARGAARRGIRTAGAPIPVVYLFTYFREDVENADHLFVHGRLVPLSEVEDRRVYEDEPGTSAMSFRNTLYGRADPRGDALRAAGGRVLERRRAAARAEDL